MHGVLRAVLTIASVALAGACAAEPDELGTDTYGGDPRVSRYDLACVDRPLPSSADEVVTVRGFTNDSYQYTGLPGVAVDVFDAKDLLLDATSSDDTGAIEVRIETGAYPVAHHARMIHDGHVDSYLYPSRPATRDAENVFFPVLPPDWRAELAGFAGVELDPAAGIVAVIVTDCAGERVEGARVTFDPPAEAVAYWDPTFTDASGTRTSMNGHAWGFNVPAGEVNATVTVDGVTYRAWPVRSFADSRTLSWRAP